MACESILKQLFDAKGSDCGYYINRVTATPIAQDGDVLFTAETLR
ncbi:hypothetical protein [Emticicia sp. TH156]|nr:hypothetical protein [Emticicia sp. TH156]